jgi:tetratricopeptide (TPR) repeat protein/tRNA A-37 threonylcarbamoyl transferase component Bud32
MARRDDTPRDLLFGLLALHNGLIDQEQLIGAFSAWSRAKGKTLAEILVERGAIDEESRALLAGMAEKQLKLHGGDPEKSLAAVAAGPSTRDTLAGLGDPDLTASITLVGSRTPPTDASATMSVGTTTSEGQRFRVLRPHAQGGLGAVFVALDAELNREVALKQILDEHADDPLNRTRFLIEAEITGGLEHPGIVPVYGLGHHDDGRPYYAMRFIRGDSLKEAIASFHQDESLKQDPGRRSLALRKLLRRFVDVCNAVGYAHGRGILHRDLKPGNVIVGKHGETLVIDWGLAKTMGHSETGSTSDERTLIPSSSSGSAETLPGSAIGTPAYMSPEQAAGDLDHLGPRSDVYSLGATLYCLLTAKAPFDGTNFGSLLRAVQKGDFPRPRTVDASIDPSLEAVCLKAMARKAEDRYTSTRALADDVERWMADEPVTATTDPVVVRVARWGRRHRPLVAGLAVLLVTSVVALASGLAVVRRERDLTEKQRDRAQTALAAESRARERTRDVLDEMSSHVIENLLTKQGQKLEAAQEAFLNKSLASYAEFAAESGSGEQERAGVARAYNRIASIRRRLGQLPRALEDERESLKRYDELAAEFPDQPRYRRGQAAARHSIAMLLSEMGKNEDAEREERIVLETWRKLVAEKPKDAEQLGNLSRSLNGLSNILNARGRLAEAIAFQREAVSIARQAIEISPEDRKRRTELALVLRNYALYCMLGGQFDESKIAYEESIRLYRTMVAEQPDDVDARESLGRALAALAKELAERGQIEESLSLWGEGISILKVLADDYPTVSALRDNVGAAVERRAAALATVGRMKEAETDFRESLAIRRRIVADFPSAVNYRGNLMGSLGNLSVLLQLTGRLEEAEGFNREAVELNRRLVDEFPGAAYYRTALAVGLENLAYLSLTRNKLSEAEAHIREAIELLRPLVARSPEISDNRFHLAKSLNLLGGIHQSQGRREDAATAFRESNPLQAQLVAEAPRDLPRLEEFALGHHNLGEVDQALRRIGEAEANFRESVALFEKLVAAAPGTSHYGAELAMVERSLADLLIDRGELAQALTLLEKGRPSINAAISANPRDPRYFDILRDNLVATARCRSRQGDLPAALAAAEQIGRLASNASLGAYAEARALARCVPSVKNEAEARTLSDRAMASLRRSAEQGKLEFSELKADTDLDALRSRHDFQLLMLDLAFPVDAFAR